MLKHGSLFSGIGGFDLASEWMGWENVFHCEYDPFCQKVLKHHFPNSKLYKDVRTFDATNYLGRIDLLSGGFPCQPFSSAGKRKGTEDERHLWPEMLRVIREVSPRYVVGENVRGLLNWSGGLVFEEVCADLEDAGYEVTPYLLPACGVNAPHRRDRIWFVAQNTDENGRGSFKRKEEPNVRGFGNIGTRDNVGLSTNDAEVRDAPDTFGLRLEHGKKTRNVQKSARKTQSKGGELTEPFEANGFGRTTPYTDFELSERGNDNREDGRSEQTERIEPFGKPRGWKEFPTQPPLCGGDDGVSKGLDGITFSKWRKESIKAYGNAIVPQVAFEIFKAIQKMEDLKNQQEEV
jgi:DNA (cytosine-5)-methyltransferase 1